MRKSAPTRIVIPAIGVNSTLITVTRHDRTSATFRVTRIKQYSKSTFPSLVVFADLMP